MRGTEQLTASGKKGEGKIRAHLQFAGKSFLRKTLDHAITRYYDNRSDTIIFPILINDNRISYGIGRHWNETLPYDRIIANFSSHTNSEGLARAAGRQFPAGCR
jgi:hypothetical protein